MLQHFIPPPVLSRFISARLFSVLEVKMKLKGLHFADVAEIQVVITDELKMVQKEEYSAAFQKLYNHIKTCIYDNGAILNKKKRYVSSIFKKSVLKHLDHTV
jgi:hypothetical protein